MKFIFTAIAILLLRSFITSSKVTSGQEFQGGKVRTFPENDKVLFDRKINSATLPSNCTKWGVITTIFPPSEALKRFTYRTDWCLVIVADVLTPKVSLTHCLKITLNMSHLNVSILVFSTNFCPI